MNKSNLKEGLKKFRKRLDDKYVIEGEYSPDTSVGNADIAKSLFTKRIISDADVACPPITYGIAGGEAEIETGYQKVVKLMGNTVVVDGVVKSAKSAKLVSRGKNQFTAFDEFIDVVGGMQIWFIGTGTFHITEYASDKETILDDCDDDENSPINLDENTRYIKIHSTDGDHHPNPMMYYTFGEVYDEEYEKPIVNELELPNVELLSAGTARDVLYSDGRLERNIIKAELSDVTAGMASSSVHTTIVFDIVAKRPITNDTLPNVILDGYQRAKWNDYLNSRLPAGKYILIRPQDGKIRLINDDFPHDNTSENKDAILASLSGKSLVYQKPITTYEQVEPFDSNVFIDNFGTILFLDEDGEEVEVEQPYYVEYKVSLVELVDSLYAKLNGDADEVATKTELVEGDVVPAQAVETEKVAPYSDQSGIHVDGEFKFQTSGGDADCSDLARIECIKGKTIKIVSMPLFIQNQDQEYSDNTFDTKVLIIGDDEDDNGANGNGHYNDFDLYISNQRRNHYMAVIFDVLAVGDNILPRDGVEYENTDFIQIFGNNINQQLSRGEFKHFFFVKKGLEFAGFIENYPNSRINGRLSIKNAIVYDLTEMFGKGFEPQTEEAFRKLISSDVFATTSTWLCSAPKQLINTSYNAFDGEFLEYAVGQDGIEEESQDDDNKATSLIKVLPNTTYGIICDVNSIGSSYLFEFIETTPTQRDTFSEIILTANQALTFTTGSKTKYIRLNVPKTTTNLTVFIYWDGSKQVQEPQKVWKYDFPNVSLRGIKKYRDEYYPDGKLDRHVLEINYTSLDYEQLDERGQILNEHQFSLYLEDIEDFLSSKYNRQINLGVESLKELEFLVSGGTAEVVEPEGDEPYLLVTSSETSVTDWEHDGAIDIQIAIASPNVLIEEMVDGYASDVSIDDFGTMEWVDRNSLVNQFGVSQPCVINYVGDYVAFLDTLANRDDVQYDAHQLLTKSSQEVSSLFSDTNFIGANGRIEPEVGEIEVLEHGCSVMSNGSGTQNRFLRNGKLVRLSKMTTYGSKKFNSYFDMSFTNQINIGQIIEQKFGIDLGEYDCISYTIKTGFDWFKDNAEDGRSFARELKSIIKDFGHGNSDAKTFMKSFGLTADFNSGLEGDFDVFHDGGEGFVKHHSWCRRNDGDDLKPYTICESYKTIFKFVRDFKKVQKSNGSRWYGTMADIGLEVKVVEAIHWGEEMGVVIIATRWIKLK